MIGAAIDKAALLEPVFGAGGQHEQLLEARFFSPLFGFGQQPVTESASAKFAGDDQAGELGRLLFGERIERDAARNDIVGFKYQETLDFHFQPFARSPHQNAIAFQRLDQSEDAADVVDGGGTQGFQRRRGDEGADALAGEQLGQQRAVAVAADEMCALDALRAGSDRAGQIVGHVLGQFPGPAVACLLQYLPRLVDGERVVDRTALGRYAFGINQENQLVGGQFDRGLRRDIFQTEVENLAGRRITNGGEQHDVVLVQPSANGGSVDFADFAGMQQIFPFDHADGLGGDEIARGHPDVGARHGGVGDSQRQQRLDLDPDRAGRLLDAGQRGVVGHAQTVDIADGRTVFDQARLDLRPYTVHQHQPDPQAVQQVDIVRQLHKSPVRHQLAAKCDDKGLAAKTMDIRRGRAEPVDEVGSVFQ